MNFLGAAKPGFAADGASADPYQWSRSLPVDFQSPGIGELGGTEVRSLVAFEGKLFAAVGYWRDTEADNPALPGGQVLVLDAPGAKWRVDLQLNEMLPANGPRRNKKRFQAIGALTAFEAHQDSVGKPLAKPVPFLLASVWDRAAGLRVFERAAGAKPVWTSFDLATGVPRASQIRSFGTHVDAVSKRELFFAGTSPKGVYSGTFDPDANVVRWSAEPETWNVTRDASAQSRILAFTECNGRLYAGSGFDLFERQDGPNPSWKKIYTYEQPSPNPHISGFRGMKAIPAPDGGEQLLIGVENNPIKIVRVDPRQQEIHSTVDLDMAAFLSQKWGTRVTYGIPAYNDFPSVKVPGVGDALLIGFEASTFQDTAGAGAMHKHPWAQYLVRAVDASGQPHYDLHRIEDPKFPNLPLVSTRTLVPSPFSEDPAGTVYAGGLDAGNLVVHNSVWIYRGVPAK